MGLPTWGASIGGLDPGPAFRKEVGMLKSKGAMIGVAAALVGAALLAAGMAVTTTSGAGTDGYTGGPNFTEGDLAGPPPAAPTDPATTPGTTPGTVPGDPAGVPGTDPDGSAGAGGIAPDALPNAGFGGTDSGNGLAAMLIMLAIAGAALVGAGATVVGAGRRN